MLKKPQNVYLPIDRFQAKVFKHRDSQKRGEWVENFALALAGESKDDFAESLLSEAQYNLYKDVVRQWRFKARQALFKELGNREPTESQIIQRCIEDYGEEFVEAFELVGKKDKRKRNQSNNHGDAGSRKAPESCTHADEGASSGSTTAPKNVSTPAIGTNGRRTGGPSLSQTSIPTVSQAESDVQSLAYSGEFQNVRLSQAQYNELGIRFGNLAKLNRAIDSLSCQIENGEKNPQNHYAELVKWASYREDMEEQKEEENAKPKLSKMEQSWINTFKAIERM